VVYPEGRHVVRPTQDQYLGVWWSVNDLRVQVGEEGFRRFMGFVAERIKDLNYIETTYLTRAWIARRT
jgi:hypothetical protein